jgi:hypothetical protein
MFRRSGLRFADKNMRQIKEHDLEKRVPVFGKMMLERQREIERPVGLAATIVKRGLRGHVNPEGTPMSSETAPKQLLHLVFGGELTDLEHVEFKDLSRLDVVGIFPNYATAYAAWRAKAQGTVDNAHMRYFIVHMHRLLEPDAAAAPQH